MNFILLKVSGQSVCRRLSVAGRGIWMMALLVVFFGRADGQITVDLTTPGASTWTVPTGVTEITVEVWGGGGGGATPASFREHGGGGSGGAYARSVLNVSPGDVIDYVIGGGGMSSDVIPNGFHGGETWFLKNTTLKAIGGHTSFAQGRTFGSADWEYECFGSLIKPGGTGGASVSTPLTSGGGGAAGSSSGNGAGAAGAVGGIGVSGAGSGANGVSGNGTNGLEGKVPGGGGSGGLGIGSVGGRGGSGMIRIAYIPPAAPDIDLISITPTSFCPNNINNPVLVFTPTGFAGASTFTVELSDAAGSFASPVAIGTGSNSPLTATLPTGLAAGTGYKVRVVNGTVISNELSVSVLAAPSIAPGSTPTVCHGTTSASLSYSGATGSPDQYTITWNSDAINDGFQNVTNASLPSGTININVPSAATAKTYTGTLTVRNSTTGCVSNNYNISVVVNERPVINSVTSLSFCQGTMSSIALPYSATISAGTYSIVWAGGAFPDIVNSQLWPSPLSGVNIPLNTPAGVYSGTFTVKHGGTGCVSEGYDFTLTSKPLPTITLGVVAPVCQGTTSTTLSYSGITNNPDQYSITWETPAANAGFSTVTNASFPAGGAPISVPVPANVAPGTYDGRLYIKNTTTNCSGSGYSSFRVEVIGRPAITPGANPSVCMGATAASLPYSNPVNTPGQYSIVWGTAAINENFSNVTDVALPANAISIAVPASAAQNTYTGKLTVRNTTTGCVSLAYDISVAVGALPSITLGANPEVCAGGTTVPLPYSATSAGPDEYSITWSTAASGLGFTNVVQAPLPTGQIGVVVPAGVTPNTYTGTLKVRNSTAGCESGDNNFSVTVHGLPVATVATTGPVLLCTGDDTLLTANTGTGYNYEWKDAQGVAGTGISYTANTTGDYYVVITDGNDCKDSSSVVPVTVHALPQVTITPGDTAVCEGELVRLHASSSDTGLVYDWKESGNLLPGNDAFQDVSASGSYYVVAGRAAVAGCVDSSAAVAVTILPLPAVSVIHDGSRLLAGSGFASYQWYKDNQPVDGETDNAFEPVSDGDYSVRVTDTNGCVGMSPAERIRVGIADAVSSTIRVYPNPVSGMLYIESADVVNVGLYNMEGRLLGRYNGAGLQIDVAHLPEGLYIALISDKNGSLISRETFVKRNQ